MTTEERRGVRAFVSPDRQLRQAVYFAGVLEGAARTGEHVWIAVVGYVIHPPLEEGSSLDMDNMTGPPAIGCYVCEEQWEPRLTHRRCKGDPTGQVLR